MWFSLGQRLIPDSRPSLFNIFIDHSCDGVEMYLATRKPMLQSFTDGAFLNRQAEREKIGLFRHEPPRNTRFPELIVLTGFLSLDGRFL